MNKLFFSVWMLFACQAFAAAGFFKELSSFNKKNRREMKDQMQNFFEIDPGKFYRSQQLTGDVLKSYIKRYGIKTIINLRGVNEADWYNAESAVAREMGVELCSIPMSAVVLSSRESLQALLSLYDKAQLPILVHCQGGADRTGEATALWLLEKQGKSKQEALKQLSLQYGHRKYVNSAKDFLIQLWCGREWLATTYNPKDYPKYCRAEE